MSEHYELVIGSRNSSSWSLRPWLVMKAFDIPFTETEIRLRQPDSKAEVMRNSPSGKVPVLKSDGLLIWDSLAIIEFLAEQYPNKPIWPSEPVARTVARCVSAEMHSGFEALRTEMPMDFVSILGFPEASGKARGDIDRIVVLWKECRMRFGGGGEFLFGAFSAADAMYAPVASRFQTYEVNLPDFGDDGTAARYRDVMLAMSEMRAWAEGSKVEN